MKILWVINTVTTEIAKSAGIQSGSDGGWLSGMSKSLVSTPGYELVVCFLYEGEPIQGEAGKMSYYSFRTEGVYKYSHAVEESFFSIIEKEKPDIIHIFGTEYPHSLSAINASEKCGMLNRTIISIQGLVSIYAKHYCADLPEKVLHQCSIHDFLKHESISNQAKKYQKRGEFEIAALQKVKHVIGRTDWDKACVRNINKNAKYHFCNETLRDAFYDGEWNYEKCEKHSIFLGSSAYPIKGLHYVLEELAKIIEEFPDSKLYVPGQSPCEKQGLNSLIHRTAYQNYLEKLIKENALEDKVIFLGNLSAEEMKSRMLKSNVFILPSSIENSPNTLAEAMLLGVPCIAADVGGVRNMAIDKKEALIYPHDENYLLPTLVSEIFNDASYAKQLSISAKKHASITHDKDKNNTTLIHIYDELCQSEREN